MFEGYQTTEELIQNLIDAGCSEDMIESLLSCLLGGNKAESLSRLAQRRAELLDVIHKEQAYIAFLDGLLLDVRGH